jgi:hypothetical protein
MKRTLIFVCLSILTLVTRAQQDYFLFLQSENNQPYYVQMNGKTFSSSSIGHLIISGLKDSVYNVAIGFPKDQFPEQLFKLGINRKDAGYQLKNMGSDGWALFNLQTLQLIKAQPVESKKLTIYYGDIKKTDVFSTLMAGLVNDSAVLYTSIAKTEPAKEETKTTSSDTFAVKTEVVKNNDTVSNDTLVAKIEVVNNTEIAKQDTAAAKTMIVSADDVPKKDTAISSPEVAKQQEIRKKDSVATAAEISPQPELVKTDSVNNLPSSVVQTKGQPGENKSIDTLLTTNDQKPLEAKVKEAKPLIVWFSETRKRNGTELIFFDMSSAEKIDTIKILIPNDQVRLEVATTDKKADDKQEDEKGPAGKLIAKIFGKRNNSKKTDNDGGKKTDSTKNISSVKVTTVEEKSNDSPSTPANDDKNKVVLTNSDCRDFAKESDVDKLRVRMLGERDADGQVTEARKFFKSKCFTTKQIKALSELFPTDEGKYKLFDAAYPFVSDTSNFKDLAGLLSEEYYINRFKAMIRM